MPNLPDFPTEYFEKVDNTEDGEYLAFLFDEELPIGTLKGVKLSALKEHLKEHTNRTKYRYVLVQVIESYEGQTIH